MNEHHASAWWRNTNQKAKSCFSSLQNYKETTQAEQLRKSLMNVIFRHPVNHGDYTKKIALALQFNVVLTDDETNF